MVEGLQGGAELCWPNGRPDMTLTQSVIDAGVYELIRKMEEWRSFHADDTIVTAIYAAMSRAEIAERDDGRDYRMQAD